MQKFKILIKFYKKHTLLRSGTHLRSAFKSLRNRRLHLFVSRMAGIETICLPTRISYCCCMCACPEYVEKLGWDPIASDPPQVDTRPAVFSKYVAHSSKNRLNVRYSWLQCEWMPPRGRRVACAAFVKIKWYPHSGLMLQLPRPPPPPNFASPKKLQLPLPNSEESSESGWVRKDPSSCPCPAKSCPPGENPDGYCPL